MALLEIFDVNNSSSSHVDNHKNNFLVLGEGPIFGINGNLGWPEKEKFVLVLVNQTQNFAWFCIIMLIVIWLLMEKKSLSLKPKLKMFNFPT